MSVQLTQLKRVSTGELVEARLHDALELDDLFDAEASWSPARIRVLQAMVNRGIEESLRPQSLHWHWAKKAAELSGSGRLGLLGDVRIFGVEVDSEWQGMLLAKSTPYESRLERSRRPLVYVDFLESAPWNWELPEISQSARFRGAGMQLMESAVRWSDAIGFAGRIGLHSLSAAEAFYRDRCNMTDLGFDPDYHGLRYFECNDEQARRFLE
jgi:hypothetical protein